ncbi:hypothetical protein V1520DRAFT_356996 [Lipomyces starkeyi]|uniref:Uncharacterized protein n=1 Tax=Lipomyces starkeyi NRRL Y-11557 TaxID=675824 RepID=A0A1E3QCL5_LIPST|nr:hypothetical protein LIPSTDRAFT_231542 [Lipomyces starkeyi NRRL Y-11557]
MAYEESLDFSTESFLDSVLSEFDKIGLSNATPSIATTAPVIHDQSIPASEQSKEPMGGNQERRTSEADDFELIDLIETHMTEYGLNIGSVSPSLESESPLNGSVFENISPLDGLTENVGGNGAEQVYGLEKTECEPQFGVDLGSVVLPVTADEISTEQEITGGNENEVKQSCEAALSVAHVTATRTEMASMDTENGTIEEAAATKPEMADVLEHREESQTSAVTIDAEDAVRDTTEEDDTTPKTSDIDSAAPVSAPSMEENIESGDSAWDINEVSSTAGVTAAVSVMESDDRIERVVPIRESDLPVEAAAKPEALIPVLDTLEIVQDADDSESASAAVVEETVPDILVEDATAKVDKATDTKDLAATDMSGTKDVEETSKSATEIGDASEPALIDLEVSDRSTPVLAANADAWSTETQGHVPAAQEPVPVAEGVIGDEPKVSEVGSAADDTSVLELEAVEPGLEGVAEPAKPAANAETATDVSAELKGIEFKEAVSATAPVENLHATESNTAEQGARSVPAPSIAEEVEPVLDATTTVPFAIDEDSKVYIYTSFTGGGMFGRNIMTATNRLQLILRSNNIGFEIIDLATNEQAKKLWARSSKGKKLPGIVKGKDIVGNYEDIEEANEFGELQQLIAEFV